MPRLVSVVAQGFQEAAQGQTAFPGNPLQASQIVADAASDLDTVGHDRLSVSLPVKQRLTKLFRGQPVALPHSLLRFR